MLFLLSPAKRLDYDSPVAPTLLARATSPRFGAEAAELIDLLRPMSAKELARLMHLSAELAQLNVDRYAAWTRRAGPRNSRPALLAFAGDVYAGLDARSLADDDVLWAQEHVLVLSGLYGLLRPLDRIQPYRLEMGTALRNSAGRDLYAYWRPRIAARLNALSRGNESPVVVNLASQEYAGAVDREALRPRVIDCVFEQRRAGRWQVIGLFAKRARGLLMRHAIRQRAATPGGLTSFDAEGWGHDAAASGPGRLVFRREAADDKEMDE